MAEETAASDPYPEPAAEDPGARTFLGGTKLGTRLGLFLILGVIAFAGAGALLYYADMLAGKALDRVVAAQRIGELVGEIQSGTQELQDEAREFLLERNLGATETFEADTKPVLENLENLFRHPAAQEVNRHVSTVNDGIAQLSQQFTKIVGVQKIVGLTDGDGLINLVQTSGAALRDRLAAMGAAALIKDLGEIDAMDFRLRSGSRPVTQAQLTKALETFKRLAGSADYSAADRRAVRQLIDAYGEDLGQLASARQALTKEIGRLSDIGGYIAPSLEALANFARDSQASARTAQEKTRARLRQMVGGGIGGGIAVLVLIGILLMSSVTRPTASLAAVAARLAHGDRGVAIPALGNYDETGEIANALTYFRENIAHTDRLRKELEEHLSRTAQALETEEAEIEEAPAPPPPAHPPAAAPASPISELSRLVTETSQHASIAAHEAERTDVMVEGLRSAGQKIVEVDRLIAEIRDQSGLLAVQASVDSGGGDQNLIVLPSKGRDSDEPVDNAMSIEARVESIQTRTKRAMDLVREVGETINEVNAVAVDLAAETSSQALQAATELLRQSEDLRGTLDSLLVRIRPGGMRQGSD